MRPTKNIRTNEPASPRGEVTIKTPVMKLAKNVSTAKTTPTINAILAHKVKELECVSPSSSDLKRCLFIEEPPCYFSFIISQNEINVNISKRDLI